MILFSIWSLHVLLMRRWLYYYHYCTSILSYHFPQSSVIYGMQEVTEKCILCLSYFGSKGFLLQASFATFDRMLSLGIEPDGITMNLLISAAGAEGNFEKVDELYRQMVSIGPAPSSRTYVHLFTAFHNSLKKNTDWIFKVRIWTN